MALVRNLNGTSDNTPPAGYKSWLAYWESKKNRKASVCSCTSCSKSAYVGGHVKKVNGTNAWYLVPICSTHNNYSSDISYEVNDHDLLALNQ